MSRYSYHRSTGPTSTRTRAAAGLRARASSRGFSTETLEPRQLMSTAINATTWQMYNASGLVAMSLAGTSAPPATISVDRTTFYFNDIQSSASAGSSPAQSLHITNTGGAALTLPTDAFTITGANASEFAVTAPTLPATIQPGDSLDLPITFSAAALGVRTATLTVKSSDAAHPTVTINLRGLGTAGAGGSLEPSLQRILDLYQIPVNVGDDDPDTTDFPVPPVAGNDEVELQRLIKAGAGTVSIELLGVFDNNKTPALHFGYYSPGTPANKTELFTVASGNDSQTVNAPISGSNSFDPGTNAFSLYSTFPAFTNRESYSEDALNTWDTNPGKQRKFRFYPLKNADGSVVPNAYVFAAEDWNVSYDFNDVVGIIRNVAPASNVTTGPEIGFNNADGAPSWDRLVFNRIEHPDTTWANVVHDKATLTIRNTGADVLDISSISLSDSSAFQVVSPTGAFSILPGQSQNVTVRFTGTSTGLTKTFVASMTIHSNDADESATAIQLRGFWQAYSEQSPTNQYTEPTLAQLGSVFGYGTKFVGSGQTLDTGGAATKVGDETLSAYWFRADANAPVTVRMLAAFHRQFNSDPVTGDPTTAASTIKWYYQGNSATTTNILTHYIYEGQSLLPHLSGSTTNYAVANFTPGDAATAFGFKVDSRFSDDALNPHTLDPGHSFRFYQARTTSGKVIPNTWIVAQDYTGLSYSNYDYQDNIYLVSNIRPQSGPSAPANVAAAGSGQGVVVSWTANTEGNVAGYDVYRSDSVDGTYTKINASLLTSTSLTDGSAMVGATSYYKVFAIDNSGTSSAATPASATRGSDTVPPGAPSGLTVAGSLNGVTLHWNANGEADLAGYDVYRSTSSDNGFVKINGALVTGTAFVDGAATAGHNNYYRVVAVDTSGNASAPSGTQGAFRPLVGTGGSYNALAYSSDGTLNFVYYDGGDRRLKFATRSAGGVWSNVQIVDNSATAPGQYVSLAVDPASDNVGIAYYDAVLGDLKYASLNRATGTFDVTTVDSNKTTGLYSSLAFDKNGLPNIAYYRKTSGDLKVAHFNGVGWRLGTVDSAGDAGKNASLAVNPKTGLLGVAYNGDGAILRYAGQNSSGTWSTSVVDGTKGAGYLSFAFDAGGRASASYYSSPTADLRYALLNKGKWSVKTVASSGTVGQYTQLSYNRTDGNARILYYDRTRDDVKQAIGTMSGWTFSTVQTAGGRRVSAAPGPVAGAVTFSWADATAGVLRLTDV